jgi:hypothetical protein
MPYAPFVLSYPLAAAIDQPLLLQKGRLAGWNLMSLKMYIRWVSGKSI